MRKILKIILMLLLGISGFLFFVDTNAFHVPPGRAERVGDKIHDRVQVRKAFIKQKIRKALERKLNSYKRLSNQQKILICQRVLQRVQDSLRNENLTPENTLVFLLFQEVLQEIIQELSTNPPPPRSKK